MTVIAYRAPFLVADRLIVDGDINVSGYCSKLSRIVVDAQVTLYVGYSGDFGTETLLNAFVKEYFSKESEAHKKRLNTLYSEVRQYITRDKNSFGGIIVCNDNGVLTTYYMESSLLIGEFESPYITEGAGGYIATGALAMGATAWQAVDVACKINGTCDYPIDGYNVLTGELKTFNTREDMTNGKI